MAEVNVSIEGLTRVRRALEDYQTDVDSITGKMQSSVTQIQLQMKQALRRQAMLVDALDQKVVALKTQLVQIQNALISAYNQIKAVRAEIAACEQKRPQLERHLSLLEQQRAQLEAQRSRADGDSGGIDAQIRAIDAQIRSCREALMQLDEKLRNLQRQKDELERKIAELKSQKMQKEAEIEETKAKLARAADKLERMDAAADTAETELFNLSQCARRFKQSSATTTGSLKTGIARCIAEIDAYMAIHLGTSGASGGSASGGSYAGGGGDLQSDCAGTMYVGNDSVPDDVETAARDYQQNAGEYNETIRAGGTNDSVERLRGVIQNHRLSGEAHYCRRASLADLGAIRDVPETELAGREYTFSGIMSAARTQNMADRVSAGDVLFEITAPAGTSALDLTGVPSYQEVMFDSPRCRIDRVEHRGFNTTVMHISIL